MVLAVEIAFRYHVANAVPCAVVEQQTAQYCLLGFQRVWRQAHLRKMGIGICSQGVDGGHGRIQVFSFRPNNGKAVDQPWTAGYALRTNKKGSRWLPFQERPADYCSPTTTTVMLAVTSWCSPSTTGYSPMALNGPSGRRISALTTS